MLFFKSKNECTHPRVSPEFDAQYCPDCGKYIENRWYLTRCSCCNIKRKTVVKNDNIEPYTNFCPNCGAKEFYVQRIGSVNFIDINFAVLIKEVKENSFKDRSQIWVERQSEPLKLLVLNL